MTAKRLERLLRFFGLSKDDITKDELVLLQGMSAKKGQEWLCEFADNISKSRCSNMRRILNLDICKLCDDDIVFICNHGSRGECYQVMSMLVDRFRQESKTIKQLRRATELLMQKMQNI
jgi:hypothetical protein